MNVQNLYKTFRRMITLVSRNAVCLYRRCRRRCYSEITSHTAYNTNTAENFTKQLDQ